MRIDLMTPPAAKHMLQTLNHFHLMRKCFAPYVGWFVENITDNWESYDLIDALKNDESDRLRKLEERLSRAREILGVPEQGFVNSFGFTDDLLTKDPQKIHDVLAEPLFVVDLHRNGFSKIIKLPRFIKRHSKRTPNSDFLAVHSNQKFAIELKTIRMEAKPKPIPGKLLGDSTIPSWWTEMFQNNAEMKIEDKDRRVLRQLENTAKEYQCGKKMLVLYTRRLGTSSLTDRREYAEQLERILRKYPVLDFVVSKDYFGEVVFYPALDAITKGMRLKHHDLEIELDSAWWTEAGMEKFEPLTRAYAADLSRADGRSIFEVPIEHVRAVSRDPSVGVFNDNETASARERVVRILRGFVSGEMIPPLEVVCEPPESPYRYKLVHGSHRFYCSLAAGFSHVPAVKGFDINTLDQ